MELRQSPMGCPATAWQVGPIAQIWLHRSGSMLKLLCIDGDEDWLNLLAHLLRKSGYAVITASSCAVALKLLAQNTISAVIWDCELLDADGSAFMRKIRARGPQVRVLLSGNPEKVPDLVLKRADWLVNKTDITGLLVLLARLAREQREKN